MRTPPSTRGWPAWPAGLFVLAGLLLSGPPALGQQIKVTSAVPDTAEQGTVDLVVTVGGENFGKGSKVSFFVTGTTNPGGVTVKGVKFVSSKTLETTIDVAPDAQTELKFDIQVMSNGRTGKGTELFTVLKKTGNDDIPPGSVTDLHVVETGFNTVTLGWTATADDGYDPTSGPAVKWSLRVRGGDSIPGCGPFTSEILSAPANSDPCDVDSTTGSPGPPGAQEAGRVLSLAPTTQYYAVVRALDDQPPEGVWSPIEEDLVHQISLTTGPFPATPWTAGIVDVCRAGEGCTNVSPPRFDFDPAGNPVMLYLKYLESPVPELATWTGSGWQIETVGAAIDTGNWAYDIGFDPASGEAAIASAVPSAAGQKAGLNFYRRTGATSEPWEAERVATGGIGSTTLRFNPAGSVPSIAYQYTGKGSGATVLRLSERLGGVWVAQDVVSGVSRPIYGLAFDDNGNPAMTFVEEGGETPTLAFAVRQGGSWRIETADVGPGEPFTFLQYTNVAFDPRRGDFSAAGVFKHAFNSQSFQVRFCERADGLWDCRAIDSGDGYFGGVSLAFDVDGAAFLAYYVLPTLFVRVRHPDGTWTRELADWNAGPSSRLVLRLGPDGQPGVAYRGAHDSTGVGPYKPVCFARRSPPSP